MYRAWPRQGADVTTGMTDLHSHIFPFKYMVNKGRKGNFVESATEKNTSKEIPAGERALLGCIWSI